MKPYRRFIRYGTLNEVGETKDLFVVLFNDSIVIASTGNLSTIDRSFQFMKMLPLYKASVKAIPDHPPSKNIIQSF